MRTYFDESQADFTCKHCGCFVSARTAVSGVAHRNHCPCCLYSRHVDLYAAGDRLCACKALMSPVGLTLKRNRDKYAQNAGELMLVHCCLGCGAYALNRVAADDDPVGILASLGRYSQALDRHCQAQGIALLKEDDLAVVERQLFGHQAVALPHF